MNIQKKFLAGFFIVSVPIVLFIFWACDRYTIPVLMYHNVAVSDVFREDTISPEHLDMHMAFLKRRGYKILTLDELVDALSTGKKLGHHCVAVTFDDGLKNNVTAAYPILKKHRIPAHFFISPGTIGDDKSLSWNDVLTMRDGGMFFGSHGMVQAYLPGVAESTRLYEIQESKRILEEKLNRKILFFAYPVGGFNADIQRLLEEAGYKAAFTTNRRLPRGGKDLYQINRIRMGDRDNTSLILTAKLSGYYNLFRKFKKPE